MCFTKNIIIRIPETYVYEIGNKILEKQIYWI